MKTTICTDDGTRVIVNPASNGKTLSLGLLREMSGQGANLTADQAGALIFAIESALEIMSIRQDKAELMPMDEEVTA
jgi:hypothetical protein